MANKRKDVHVVPHDKGWAVKVEGNKRNSAITSTQKEAQQKGIEIAKRNSSELSIHGKDGAIRQKNSYGDDPREVKG